MTSNQFGATPRQEPNDQRQAECPYCRQALSKIPDKKTKCRYCGEFMFVRTRPEGGARVVATKAEADRIDSDWKIVTSAREPDFKYIASETEIEQERERLKQSFLSNGYTEPSDDDVKWAVLNKKSFERSIRFTMAEFLARRWKLMGALGEYLYVCILDLNDSLPSLSPAPLDQITRIAKRLLLSNEELRALFAKYYAKSFRLSPDECWSYLERALWPAPSSLRKPMRDPASIARAPQPNEVEQVLDLPGGRTEAVWRDAKAVAEFAAENPALGGRQ